MSPQRGQATTKQHNMATKGKKTTTNFQKMENVHKLMQRDKTRLKKDCKGFKHDWERKKEKKYPIRKRIINLAWQRDSKQCEQHGSWREDLNVSRSLLS